MGEHLYDLVMERQGRRVARSGVLRGVLLSACHFVDGQTAGTGMCFYGNIILLLEKQEKAKKFSNCA